MITDEEAKKAAEVLAKYCRYRTEHDDCEECTFTTKDDIHCPLAMRPDIWGLL